MSDNSASNNESLTQKWSWPVGIIVTIWALISSYIALWFKPRIALPFFALTAVALIILPFQAVFFGTIIFGMAHNPSFNNAFVINLGGMNTWILEVVMFFLFAVIVVELFTKRVKFEFSPMFFVIGLFLLSTILQTVRGYMIGYEFNQLRTTFRNAVYPILIIPTALYFGSNGKVKKLIDVFLIGWIAAIAVYFLMYFGILPEGGASLSGRLAWPPTMNIILVFPMLLTILSDKTVAFRDNIKYWAILIFSISAIIATQTRSIWAILFAQLIIMIFVLAFTKPKGQKLLFLAKIFLALTLVGILGILLLRIVTGDNFDYFLHAVETRALSLFEWRKDIAIASRRHQAIESIRLAQQNWLFGQGVGVKWYSIFTWGESRIDGLYFMLLVHQGIAGLVLLGSVFALWMQRSLFLLSRHKLIGDPLILSFVLAQPAFILATLANGVASSSAYVLPTNTIVIFISAMITEKLYSDLKKNNYIPKE